MSEPEVEPRRQVSVTMVVALVVLVLGAGACLAGVWMVGGLGWVLIVAGAAMAAGALTLLPT